MSGRTRRFYPLASLAIVEDIESYELGGFHPVHLGDVLHTRYKILHKLGWGGYSTTWLARDTVGNAYVALKIQQAAELTRCPELKLLQSFASLPGQHPGRHHMRMPLDNFVMEGPNGKHNVFIYDLAGPSLHDLYNMPGPDYAIKTRRLRADIAHRLNVKIIEAVDFLHSNRICHGDLTTSNILLKLKSVNDLSEDQIYELFGRPHAEKLRPAPGPPLGDSAPRYVVHSAKIPHGYMIPEITLSDFGEAFPFDAPPKPEDVGIPYMYRAPETIFDSKYDQRSEIWALACILYEVRAGDPMFLSLLGGPDEVLLQMVQMKGRLPDPWWGRWSRRTMSFQDNGRPLEHSHDGTALAIEWPLKNYIGEIGTDEESDVLEFEPTVGLLERTPTTVPAEEAEMMRELLEGMLQFEPEKRSLLEQICSHPWIVG